MQVHVNTDNHIEGGAGLIQHVESVVEGALARFGPRVTRVEVQLSDQNSGQKSGDRDKRCVMEARLAGLAPITVTAEGALLDPTIAEAADKLEKALERTLDRRSDPRGRTSFAGEP